MGLQNKTRKKIKFATGIGVLVFLGLACGAQPLSANCLAGQTGCCKTLSTYRVQCGPNQYCSFNVCTEGAFVEQTTQSQCVVCACGIFQSWFFTGGVCYQTSPVKSDTLARASYDRPIYAFVRGCDGRYSLVSLAPAA